MSLVSSVRWVACAQAMRVGSQLISLVVLARLLPPHAYGLIAMAMTVTNLAFMVRDMGTMAALIQRPQLNERLTSTLYWVNAGLAVFIALGMAALAAPLATLYAEPRLTAIIAALALTVPASSLAAVQQALMERELQFRVLAGIEAISAAAGVIVALTVAIAGGEAWALVWQMVTATSLTAILSWRASRWRPRLLFDLGELRSVFGFSGHYSIFQFVNYFQRNADSAVIGKVLGSASLGLYSMAAKVMLFPLQNITYVATRVLLPAMSRRQHAPEELRRLFVRASTAIAIVTAPLMAGLFALREPFVALTFGERWQGTAELLKWLAAVGFVQSVNATPSAVLLALGKTRLMLQLAIFGAVVQVACMLLAVRWGTQGVAAGYLVANVLICAPGMACVLRLLGMPALPLLSELAKPVLAASVMLAVLWLLGPLLRQSGLPLPLHFATSVVVGAGAYVFALLVLLRQDTTDLRSLLRLREA